MIRSGLVSITFRKLTPQTIIDLVAQAGLDGIEWGGDIHVPHGDLEQARKVRKMTEDAGLQVASYGSYYRVGHGEPVPFSAVLDTAVTLGAPLIRVWAGKQGSENADDETWDRVVTDSRKIADLAAQAGITVAYEFHGNTLTDTNASALKLLETVAYDNMKTYWQPPGGATEAYKLQGLDMILPWLTNLHVFSWRTHKGQRERQPLAARTAGWQKYLEKVATTGRDHFAMLEFVRNDAPESFLADAKTLKEWLTPYQ